MLAMVATKILPAVFFLGAVASFGVTASLAQGAPQPSASPAARIPYSAFKEIHVDQLCHILPYPVSPDTGKNKPRLRKDLIICHLETVNASEHLEDTVVGNEVRQSRVRIREQEYVLQNVTTEPRWFVVEQFVPEGWVVDSDPQPSQMTGATALFRVHTEPGEIVRLHVGMRHAKPLHAKLSNMKLY
jgi:hypothetical protein